VNEIKTLLKSTIDYKADKYDFDVTKAVLQQLKELGLEKVSELSSDFREIQLEASDSQGRAHLLHLQIPDNFPRDPPHTRLSIPADTFNFTWASSSTISKIYEQFCEQLEMYQEYWNDVSEIRANLCILEPDNPGYATTSFTIDLGAGCSMLLQLNPLFQPQENVGGHVDINVPQLTFMGPDHTVSSLRDAFYGGLKETWSPTLSTYDNLVNILKTDDFSLKTKFDDSEDASEGNTPNMKLFCGICCAFTLEGKIPDQICKSSGCGQSYHYTCLATWFNSLATTRADFDTIYGTCPTCMVAMEIPAGV